MRERDKIVLSKQMVQDSKYFKRFVLELNLYWAIYGRDAFNKKFGTNYKDNREFLKAMKVKGPLF